MAVTWDLAFIGRPPSANSACRWQAEVDLVNASGQRVLVAETPEDLIGGVDAGLILVADPGLAGRLRDIPPEAQIVVRRAGPASPGLASALGAQLARRVVAAPLGPGERALWSEEVPDRWLTASDWPPLVDAETLAQAARRPAGPPWRVAIADPAASGFTAAALAEALAAALADTGLSSDSVAVAEVAAGDSLQPHILVSGTLPEPDTLCAALEAGSLVVVPARPGSGRPAQGRGDPVLTCDWDDLPAVLCKLVADPSQWRRHALAVTAIALESLTDGPFLGRLADGTCGPALKPPRARRGAPATPTDAISSENAARIEADIALVGDFRRRDEVVLQAAAQIRAHAASGRSVVLAQVWNGKSGGDIHPVIDALVHLGQTRVLPPWGLARVACAQVTLPRLTIPALSVMGPAIEADRWIVTETETDTPDWDAAAQDRALSRLYGTSPRWFASNAEARAALAAQLPGPVAAWPLSVPGPEVAKPPRRASATTRPVIGIVAFTPAEADGALAALGTDPGAEIHVLLAGHRRTLETATPDHVRVLSLDGQDIDGFIRLIDTLVVPPGVPFERTPRLAVGLALARGVAVIATPSLAPALGGGPRYARSQDWPALIAAVLLDPPEVLRAPNALPRDDTPMARLMGLSPAGSRARPGAGLRAAPRILFVTANGVGLGHVTRLSAIARRLPDGVEPVFATMSQAVGVLRDMGFPSELLTGYSGKPAVPWRASLRRRMTELLDHHRPAAVVLDSSNPYPGLLEAAIARADTRLVWVRRGMWRASQDHAEFLSRAPYFERVIEPQDIAEAGVAEGSGTLPAEGLSAHGRVVRVSPIGLLDEDDLLDRTAARRALGLPETPPPGGSVLVQLGSGTTRDLNTLLGEVFAHLRRFEGLEIVLAQWLNAPSAYEARWPSVRILSGYPIPRYYRAFDFTISAAGYNSFNDLLRFGIPTIFIANDAECMDDQGARARFAEEAEAAFNVPEADISALSDCVAAILKPQVRDFLTDRARAIALPNGAAEAAASVMELVV